MCPYPSSWADADGGPILLDVAHNPHELPADLPAPVDDGACQHLVRTALPHLRLESTAGTWLNTSSLAAGRSVVFVYPKTGIPGVEPPSGWDRIPGARGCTPQTCAYRDDYSAFQQLGVEVFGLSAQTNSEQREFAEREHVPFPLLSDPALELAAALHLPTFVVEDLVLYRRVTLVVNSGRIVYVRYPVFPPDSDADATLAWLRAERA